MGNEDGEFVQALDEEEEEEEYCTVRHTVYSAAEGCWCVEQDASPASEAIVRVAVDRGAELIVLVVRGRAGLSDRLGWSTAYGVVREAPCPVLTVRSTDPG